MHAVWWVCCLKWYFTLVLSPALVFLSHPSWCNTLRLVYLWLAPVRGVLMCQCSFAAFPCPGIWWFPSVTNVLMCMLLVFAVLLKVSWTRGVPKNLSDSSNVRNLLSFREFTWGAWIACCIGSVEIFLRGRTSSCLNNRFKCGVFLRF